MISLTTPVRIAVMSRRDNSTSTQSISSVHTWGIYNYQAFVELENLRMRCGFGLWCSNYAFIRLEAKAFFILLVEKMRIVLSFNYFWIFVLSFIHDYYWQQISSATIEPIQVSAKRTSILIKSMRCSAVVRIYIILNMYSIIQPSVCSSGIYGSATQIVD